MNTPESPKPHSLNKNDELTIDWLERELFEQLAATPDSRFFLAYSGGVDSTVLLHLLSQLQQELGFELVALHVNHNLQDQSALWANHCESVCRGLGVEFRSVSLTLNNASEALARAGRYGWFAKQVRYGDFLLTAHHRQDRAETLLFNLMRGAGSTGLSSLRAIRPFHGAKLARPLLNASREQITRYANQHKLNWVEDPSNLCDGYARNQIRHRVLPTMTEFREDAIQNIARAAANLEQENGLLREVAIGDLVDVREQPAHPIDGSYAICVDDMSHLSDARKSNLLRFWLQSLRLHTPSRRLMDTLLKSIETPPNSTAVLQEGGKQFRFYRGFMYVMPAQLAPPEFGEINWQDLMQPVNMFNSRWRLDATNKLVELAGKRGGNSIRLVERSRLDNPKALQGHSLNVKKWMQEMAIPPWRRQSLPLLTLKRKRDDILLGAVDHQIHSDWVSLEIAS